MDKNLFREEKGNNPEIIRESQRRRFANVDIVDEHIELDKESRKRQLEVENHRKVFNKANKQLNELEKSVGDATELLQRINDKEAGVLKAQEDIISLLETFGNFVNNSVPVVNNEADKVESRAWGEKRGPYLSPGGQKLRNHVDIPQVLQPFMGMTFLHKYNRPFVMKSLFGFSLIAMGVAISVIGNKYYH